MAKVLDLATKLISEVVQIILPIIYDSSIVERVRVAHSDTKTAFLTLPVSHHTIVEIVMAGLDMRGTQYHPCSDEKKLPKGILCLPPPPETGIDSEGNRMVEEIDKHLKKFNWQGSKNFVDALDAYVVWKFTDSDSSKVKPQERIILAADAIEYSSDKKNLTYYLIIDEPEDIQDRAALEKTLVTVREHYPRLMCMILNSEFTIVREDRKTTLLPLGELLPKKQQPSTCSNCVVRR